MITIIKFTHFVILFNEPMKGGKAFYLSTKINEEKKNKNKDKRKEMLRYEFFRERNTDRKSILYLRRPWPA